MLESKRAWYGAVVAAVALGAFIGCAAMKSVGDSMGGPIGGAISGASTLGQSAMLNEKDEATMGRSIAYTITNTYPVSHDPQLTAYVNYIGHTLADVSQKPDRHYIFGVLDTETVGAYSAPDGYIFITKGTIKFAHDEAELAGVIGHELTHVLKQHGLHAVQAEMTKSGLLRIGTAAAGVEQAMPALDAAGDVITKNGYDKPQEFEADKGAVYLLITAGYDPNSFLNFVKRLDTQQASGGGMMSTHPGTHERIGKIAQEIGSFGKKGGATLADRYKATVSPSLANAG
jgi:predicted Zn-dependent protease